MSRYERNKPIISDSDQESLSRCTAAVVGLGGLGGHIAEQLVRIGFGSLILIDCDRVEPSNLNRQLFADTNTVGVQKTAAAQARLSAINPDTALTFYNERLEGENAVRLLSGADIVLDALDNIPSRRVLRDACVALNLPFVHGAIGGWYGQVSFVNPADKTFDWLYPDELDKLTSMGNPAFTPALVASIQVSQAVKWRLQRGDLLSDCVLFLDLLTNSFDVIRVESCL